MSTPRPVAARASTLFAQLLEARTGQQIAANRTWRIETALAPLMRELGFDTLEALAARLASGQADTLAQRVVDALLNHESSFFRDAAVFDAAVEAIATIRPSTPGQRLRLWSAGCSTGQEPLSLAMQFAERRPVGGYDMPEIVATDVSATVLARARAARFSPFEIQRGLPVRRMLRWFEEVGGDWIARPELVRHVAFRRHNLVSDPLPGGMFDAILCRNVLLYFSQRARRAVFDRLAQALRPGGLLVLGPGETVIGQTDAFEPSRAYRGLYRLTAEPERCAATG